METARILVTGATGFLGTRLTRALARREDLEVHVLARPSSRTSGVAPAGVTVHRSGPALEELEETLARARPEVLVHLAASEGGGDAPGAVDRVLDANLRLGTRLLELASRDRPVGLVYAGSFFEGVEGGAPWTLYGATKRAFHEVVRYYVAVGRARGLGLRLYGVYGPGDPRRKVLRLLLESRGAAEPLPLSPGEQVLDLVHVDDVVAAFERGIEHLRAGREPGHAVVDIGSGEGRTLRAVAGTLEELSGRPLALEWGALPYRAHEPRRAVADLAPARDLLGWAPRVPLERGLAEVLAAEEGPAP